MTPETRAGIVAILALAALISSIVFLRGDASFRDRGYDLHLVVTNASGLSPGASVQMSGVEIGRVSRIRLTDDRKARITMRIRPEFSIPVGSRFGLATTGLLGDRYVAITPAPGSGPALVSGSTVAGADPISIDDIADRVVRVARRAEETLININRVIGDPRLATALQESIENVRATTATARRAAESVERTAQSIDRTVSAVANEVPAIAAQLKATSAALAASAREVNALVRDVAADGDTAKQIRATVTAIEHAANGIEKMVRDLQGVINEREVAAVRASIDQARAAVADARSAVSDARAGIAEARTVVSRAGTTIDRVNRVIPERLDLPDFRSLRLEYGLWYESRRLGNDISLTFLPDANRSYIFTFRDIGGESRIGLQIGNRLDSRLSVRYGLIDSHLGGGLDYRANRSMTYSLDLYNIGRITANVYLRYAVAQDWTIALRVGSVINQPTFGIGLFRRF
jgi:phospholipid/cholesterol/gamma-HCH transport system substrate-binding protein